METLIVLGVSLLLFRLLGALGVGRFASWPVSAAHAMAVMLVMTGTSHFMPDNVTFMPNTADFIQMVPPVVPFPEFMVYASGVLELLGALGLILARTRRIAGICVVLMFAVLLPANIYAAVSDIPFNGEAATPLWIRIPQQLVYAAVVLWGIHSAPREWPSFLWSRRRVGTAAEV